MITVDNLIPNQYARVGQAFSFQIPANTFGGTGVSVRARVARAGNIGISLDRFWLDYEPITRTLTGTPADFDDEGVLQLEVIGEDSVGDTISTYFTIITYASGTTTTTVLPRTSADCTYVITAANKDSFDWGSVTGGQTIGLVGNIGNIAAGITRLNGTAAAPILITNVDGICEMDDGGGNKALIVHKSNHFKIIGQYAEVDSFNQNVYGIKIKTGSSANKVLSDGNPDPTFNFGANGGGTALEVENHCLNDIELFGIHIPYSGSAGIKVRTKLDRLTYSAASGNNLGNNTVVISASISNLIADTGYLSIGGDNYEYSSYSGSTFTLVGTLSQNYTTGAVVETCTGIRSFHDMSGVKIHHNYLENIDTEGLYMGEGFYEGRPSAGNILPHDIRKVRVEWNIVKDCGYEPLQVKNCVEDCKIRFNDLDNASFRSVSAQQFGLFISDGTVGEVSHNNIRRVSGSGFRIYFSGPMDIYNNVQHDAGWNTGTTQRQALYSRRNGTVIQEFSMNVGGYQLTNYKSRTDLGTVEADLLVNYIHNTCNKYGDGTANDDNAAIDVITNCHFRYGNNLFSDGADYIAIDAGNTTDLGGNLFITPEQANYVSVNKRDFRISKSSLASESGIDLTAFVTDDYNYNVINNLYHSGAFIAGTKSNTDNFIYGKDYVFVRSSFTEFQWYVTSDAGVTWAKIPDATLINYTPSVVSRGYRLGVIPKVKDYPTKIGAEVFSNTINL